MVLGASLAFAAVNVTLTCPASVKVGSTAVISGTAPTDVGISIKVVSDKSIVYYNVVKANASGAYSDSFIPAAGLAGKTVTVVAGYGDNVATKTITINSADLLNAPTLTVDSTNNTVGQDIEITFADNPDWGAAIAAIKVNGSSIPGNKYTVTSTKITINSSVFSAVGNYSIVIEAAGYNNATVTQTIATSGGGNTGGSSSGDGSDTGKEEDKGNTPQNQQTGTVTTTTTASATTDSAGKASATVTASQVNTAVSTAIASVAGTDKKAAVEIKVEAASNAKTVETTISKTAINNVAGSDVQALTVSSPVASITFDQGTLAGIADAASGDVNISAAHVDVNTLSESVKEQVGDRPVYNFSVTSGDSTISQFNGSVTVAVPYQLADGEDPENVVIYYINASGELETVKDCYYDAESGKVVFKTNHFSQYAVGYNEVNFSDVSGWYEGYVNYLAARDIISGNGDGKFAPKANITRAEFAQILANMSGDDLSSYTTSSFADVKTTAWYSKAVAWAYAKGVVQGADGKYNPNANISRQDIALMLTRYTDKIAGTTLAATEDEATFADQSNISGYAEEAVSAMQQAGIIGGYANNTFAPQANATRAEASKMIALLLQDIIG